MFFFSCFSVLVTLPMLIAGYKPMDGRQLLMLLLCGASATGGQYSITMAYQKAPAKEISVFDYTQVVFAAVLGYLFLGQMADRYSYIGYAVIIAAAIFKWYEANKTSPEG